MFYMCNVISSPTLKGTSIQISVLFCLASSSLVLCSSHSSCLSFPKPSPNPPQTLVLVCAHQDLLRSTDVERECDDTACLDCLPSLADHSLALPVVQCLTIIISIFSPVFSLYMAGGYLVLVILSWLEAKVSDLILRCIRYVFFSDTYPQSSVGPFGDYFLLTFRVTER